MNLLGAFNWYGFLIGGGMIICIFAAWFLLKKRGYNQDIVINMALITIPCAIIGARLYYVIFNWSDYSQNLFQIINTRGGGLAIHGGLLFGLVCGAILCRVWKINPLNGLDLAIPAVALGQSIGRWGNFFNEEAYGGPTTLPWGLDINGTIVHPTFLYESIWTFMLFLFLSYVDKNRKFTGQVFFLYCILYSVERFFVEGLRTDSLMLGSFKVAQVVSALAFAAGIVAYIYFQRRKEREI